ncbi:MAG: tRNA (adenosine(37)-N6)-dimethylallyltransferase MiaA [Gaiellaceae bacterium]
MSRATVLAIFGPTASGKSAVAEALARRLPAELVSADSAALYRGLPILTAAPSFPTRLVGILELSQEASVAAYARLAHAAIDDVLEADSTPVVVGGTGLYLRAALAELGVPPQPPRCVRERWQRLYDELGPEGAHDLLRRRDPRAAEGVHANDRRRVVRALELSELGSSLRPAESRLWSAEMRHPTIVFGLDVPHGLLEARIHERTRAMFEHGVEAEVREALRQPLSATAAKILGLREIAELPREQAIEVIERRTRRFAAYQRKWMRRIPGVVSVRGDGAADEVAEEIVEMARAGQRLPAPGAGRRAARADA